MREVARATYVLATITAANARFANVSPLLCIDFSPSQQGDDALPPFARSNKAGGNGDECSGGSCNASGTQHGVSWRRQQSQHAEVARRKRRQGSGREPMSMSLSTLTPGLSCVAPCAKVAYRYGG
jgi:hypothetical protein